MKEHTLEDEFGRKTIFVGEHLVCETTDNTLSVKPQWLDVDVWRTDAGNFVVKRVTNYRIRHAVEECPRAEGYDLAPATEADTYACPECMKQGFAARVGTWAQTPRIDVSAYTSPQELILSFSSEGRFNNLARSILAQVSEQDERVNQVWNTVVVP